MSGRGGHHHLAVWASSDHCCRHVGLVGPWTGVMGVHGSSGLIHAGGRGGVEGVSRWVGGVHELLWGRVVALKSELSLVLQLGGGRGLFHPIRGHLIGGWQRLLSGRVVAVARYLNHNNSQSQPTDTSL